MPRNLKDIKADSEINKEIGQENQEHHRTAKSLQFYLDPSSPAFDSSSDQEPFLLDFDEQLEAAIAAQVMFSIIY